jgi:uncharacterized protein (TIGR02246 family)
MMLLPAMVFAAAAGATASACDPRPEPVAQARAVAVGIVEADNASALERVLEHYAPDAMLLPPNEPPVQGHAAIRPRYEGLFAAYRPEIVARVDEVCVSGALAFVRGHNGGRLVSRSGGADRALDDAYLMMLRRGADGRWRISHLMWHRAGGAGGP